MRPATKSNHRAFRKILGTPTVGSFETLIVNSFVSELIVYVVGQTREGLVESLPRCNVLIEPSSIALPTWSMTGRERGCLVQEEEVGERPGFHEVIRVLQRRSDAVDPMLVIVLVSYPAIPINLPAVAALREDALTKSDESFGVYESDLHDYQSCFRILGSIKIAYR
jgi:hypothetical protein